MSNQEIIDSFKLFAGPQKFRKFVDTACGICIQKERMMFWQEKLWLRFSLKNPCAPQSPDEILAIFRYCPVHWQTLHQCESIGMSNDIRSTLEYDQAEYELFPFAMTPVKCVKCEESRELWITNHPELCRILRTQTTYIEYWKRRFGENEVYQQMLPAILKRKAEIEAELADGDELWEWDTGGWHRLAGRNGVAIVRDGKIIKKWCEQRS